MAQTAIPAKPQCPACGGYQVLYRSTLGSYRCRVCGHEWVREPVGKRKGDQA